MLRWLMIWARILPRCLTMWWGGILGKLAYHFVSHERQKAEKHLAIAFPEKSEKERSAIAKKCFAHWGRMLFLLVSLPKKNIARTLKVKNIEELDILKKHSAGKGIIIVSGHIGNWEALAALVSQGGYPLHVVAREIYYKRYDNLITNWRHRYGSKVIYQTASPRSVLRVLRNNEVLGIMADQDVKSIDGIFVKFFGKEAHTTTAPAAFAMGSGAPIVPLFIVYEGDGFRFVSYDPIFVPDGFVEAFADMSLEEKNKISHRAQAINKLVEFLQIKY